MPKELIYGERAPYGEEDPGRSVVDVRWDRESGYFQIATACIDRSTHETYIPAHIRAEMPEGEWAFATAWDGFYVDLDRAGINKLIRTLRRARDAAFGRDE